MGSNCLSEKSECFWSSTCQIKTTLVNSIISSEKIITQGQRQKSLAIVLVAFSSHSHIVLSPWSLLKTLINLNIKISVMGS